MEPAIVGQEFYWKEWPLHVTIASVFAVDWNDELLGKLEALVSSTPAMVVQAVDEGFWGKEGAYHCAILEKSPDIMEFHNRVYSLLTEYGAIFNEPEFHGDGYSPHSTIQKHFRLNIGDTAELTSLSIVDMFPNKDHEQRRILSTHSFKH